MTQHPLAYPLAVSATAVAACVAPLPLASPDQRATLAVLVLGVAGGTGYRVIVALRGRLTVPARRVRQQYRLTSRSWMETGNRWVPVYYDPTWSQRLPSGRVRRTEPPGRLIDDPSRPDPDAARVAARASTWRRRLVLDAQPAVTAPFIGALWSYLAHDGLSGFLGATGVAVAVIVWLTAIRGSDPS